MQIIKNIIYVGCIILLCVCGLNVLFVRKMYVHLFSAAVIPAQVYIFYGIAMENSTDWIKWSLQGLGPVSFIGGFRVSDSEM